MNKNKNKTKTWKHIFFCQNSTIVATFHAEQASENNKNILVLSCVREYKTNTIPDR